MDASCKKTPSIFVPDCLCNSTKTLQARKQKTMGVYKSPFFGTTWKSQQSWNILLLSNNTLYSIKKSPSHTPYGFKICLYN